MEFAKTTQEVDLWLDSIFIPFSQSQASGDFEPYLINYRRLGISFFLNQCKGHNQDASKTTPSYIALMPFQAPSRLLRELIQLAAREPQTSPAELIHTRSKRGSCQKAEGV